MASVNFIKLTFILSLSVSTPFAISSAVQAEDKIQTQQNLQTQQMMQTQQQRLDLLFQRLNNNISNLSCININTNIRKTHKI